MNFPSTRLVGRDFRSLSEFINHRMLLFFLQLRALTRHTDYVRALL